MPSGAKKRKAAKKKKEIESNSTSTKGENELKSIDEKGSDGGEGDSPAYRNHGDDQNNQFNEGSEEVEEIENKPSAAVAKSSEQVRKVGVAEGGKESVVEIEWDMKSEESLENKDVSVVKIDSPKESNYENRNNGGSNEVTETSTAKNSKVEPYNSAAESSADSVKESVNSVAESSDDLVKAVTSVSEMQSGDTANVILEKPLVSPIAETDLGMKNVSKTREDKVHVLPDEVVRISSLEEPETREFDGKVSSSVSQSPIPESTNGVEHVKDSNTAERSENQPPVAPLIVHKTSWLSCCGLFDVLSGSNR